MKVKRWSLIKPLFLEIFKTFATRMENLTLKPFDKFLIPRGLPK
jgi:hypothetical protein